jgi:hypothetical protein
MIFSFSLNLCLAACTLVTASKAATTKKQFLGVISPPLLRLIAVHTNATIPERFENGRAGRRACPLSKNFELQTVVVGALG